MRLSSVVISVVCLGISAAGCGSTPDVARPPDASNAVRVVHASVARTASPEQADAALQHVLRWSTSGEDSDVEAVVLVANFEPATGETVETATARFVKVLGELKSGMQVYVMPAGRELKSGESPAAALKTSQDVIAAVQKQLRETSAPIQLTDLSTCYAPTGTPAACLAQLPGRSVRLVGYPGFHAAANAVAADLDAMKADVKRWIDTFDKATAAPAPEATTILVAPLASQIGTRAWGTADERKRFMAAAVRPQIALGMAGEPSLQRVAYDVPVVEDGVGGRWLRTPTLALGGSGTGRAADGASVISVASDGTVSRDLFWYAPAASAFRAHAQNTPATTRDDEVPYSFTWLWSLGNSLADSTKAAVFFIAVVAAFLTVAAVWQIPSSKTSAQIAAGAADKPPSLLENNFARTVVSGLGGLALATLTLKAIGSDTAAVQEFYVVWFIVTFLSWLAVSSVFKAAAEAFRVTSYVGRQKTTDLGVPIRRLIWSKVRWTTVRGKWFLLTWLDAFFNLIQGHNQLESTLWAKEIRSYQDDALTAIDKITESLRVALAGQLDALAAAANPPGPRTDLSEIRIAVSVLSNDGTRVFYVSWPPGSSSKEFGTKSIAYVSVAAGVTRWYDNGFEPQKAQIVLLDKSTGDYAGIGDASEPRLMVDKYFQARGSDYRSFIVIPIPLRPQGGRRAGLHISFRGEDSLRKIWTGAIRDVAAPANTYAAAPDLLNTTPAPIGHLLRQSIDVIESLLRHFNEEVFEELLRVGRRV